MLIMGRWTVRAPPRVQAWKPERAHHDSISGRCVLRMDHYCARPRPRAPAPALPQRHHAPLLPHCTAAGCFSGGRLPGHSRMLLPLPLLHRHVGRSPGPGHARRAPWV
jgi:hypothetical protein